MKLLNFIKKFLIEKPKQFQPRPHSRPHHGSSLAHEMSLESRIDNMSHDLSLGWRKRYALGYGQQSDIVPG